MMRGRRCVLAPKEQNMTTLTLRRAFTGSTALVTRSLRAARAFDRAATTADRRRVLQDFTRTAA
jgi:hypothetical protein